MTFGGDATGGREDVPRPASAAVLDELARMGLTLGSEADAQPLRLSEEPPTPPRNREAAGLVTPLGSASADAAGPPPSYRAEAAVGGPTSEAAGGGPTSGSSEPVFHGRRTSAEALTGETVLRPRAQRPGRGWRRAVFRATRGVVNPGMSPAEHRARDLLTRVRTPVPGCYKIAVISLKGGVGKTTTTAALGSTFASVRGDRVVAIDANPDRGTLIEKVTRESPATVRTLVSTAGLQRYADVRALTSQAPSRLEVLASETDPTMSQAFSEDDYRAAVAVLERFYNLVLTDCGTGLLHSAMQGALALADSLVVVSSGSLDGARSASATLDWLDAHGHGRLVRHSVAVLSAVHRDGGEVDLDALETHFAARCRLVVRIPWDPHLATGAEIDLEQLRPATRDAYLRLAAAVADGFTGSRASSPSG